MRVGIQRVLVSSFLVATLFPYIGVVPLGADTEPWSLITSLIGCVVLSRVVTLNAVHLSAALLAVTAIIMLSFSSGGLSTIKNAFGYISIFSISVVTTYAMKINRKKVAKFIDISMVVWLVVGLAQKLIDKSLLTFLVFSSRTSETRGVTGLAAEPTFYASMILLMVLWRAFLGLSSWHVIALLFVTFVLAGSSQVVLIILIVVPVIVFCLLFKPKYYALMTGLLLAAGGLFISVSSLMANTRLAGLIEEGLNNPSLVLAKDESVNERAMNAFAGPYSIFRNGIFPQGISPASWVEYINQVAYDFPKWFWFHHKSFDRPLSALAIMIFQMGVLCLPLFLATVVALARWPKTIMLRLSWFVAFTLIMITALPLAHPMIGAIFGALAYTYSKRTTSQFEASRPVALHD